ncbi:MAG: histidine phosphatase family protein [Chloroflexota bacterium]|nr:histidine phosphatase family protein [Chloroflexota bacterium]
MKFSLVRHGETEWNKLGWFQGQYDTQLNEAGLEQARVIGRASRQWGITAIYSSPLTRTMQVANEMGRTLDLPVHPRDGLKELALGDLEGVQGEEMRQGWPEVFSTWNNHPERVVMPGGESLANLEDRSWQVILDLEGQHPREAHLALVSHNFTIRAICGKMLGMPLENFHRLRLALGSVCTFESDERGRRLLTYNSTGHLLQPSAITTD